jgi:asparagine synthase (glutamine-hydrolysing)
MVADRYGTDHHDLDLSPDLDLEDTIRQFAFYADEPCGDSSSLPGWYLSKLCRNQVTVALSGEGADELFGGYLTYRADRLARLMRFVPAVFRRLALAAAHYCLPVSEDKISLEYMIKRFLEGSFLSPLQAHCYWNGAFSEAEKQALCAFDRQPVWNLETLRDDRQFLRELNGFLWFDQKYYLPDDILAKVDRMSMAHSLEVRPPFLDHKVVEFAGSLPEQFKIQGRQQKYLLKLLMRNKLPAEVLERPKMGFDIPAHDWLRRELKQLLLEVTRPAVLARTGLFRPDVLHRWMQDHFERRRNIGFHLWGLVILLLWMEKWQVQSPFQRLQPTSLATGIGASVPTH